MRREMTKAEKLRAITRAVKKEGQIFCGDYTHWDMRRMKGRLVAFRNRVCWKECICSVRHGMYDWPHIDNCPLYTP